jgi:hypothetical protein
MSLVKIQGNASGTGEFTIAAPNSNTNRTLTLPDNTGTILTAASTPAFASTIGVGGATAAASGAGITFPATASASSDANTLDDYEEGTWNPTVRGSTTAGTTTYDAQSAWYTKIGNTVHVGGYVQWSAQTGTGNLQIANLPFTANGSYYSHLTFGLNNISMTAGNYGTLLETILNNTALAVYQGATGGSSLSVIPLDTSGGIYFGGVYII